MPARKNRPGKHGTLGSKQLSAKQRQIDSEERDLVNKLCVQEREVPNVTRYRFDEVRAALHDQWGFGLSRGSSDRSFDGHDGRWDVAHSKTGYILNGNRPGIGYGYWRRASLADVVRACGLAEVIQQLRAAKKPKKKRKM